MSVSCWLMFWRFSSDVNWAVCARNWFWSSGLSGSWLRIWVISSFRKSCLPSVCWPICDVDDAADDDEFVVDGELTVEIMRGLLWILFASRPHVEAVDGAHRVSGGRTNDRGCRDTFAIGWRRE